MKVDLQNGKITSYNFDLIAYDSEGDNAGSFVQMSQSGDPYFRVYFKDSTRNLDIFKLTKTEFSLNSHNWIPDESGMQLNLTNGSITAFNNFNLKATINTTNQNDKRYNGSYVQIKSGDPFFTVHFEDSYSPKKSLDLIKIGINNWFMQSQDWVNGKSGIRFDMAKGKITAYSFTIKAYKTEKKYIYIDSTDNTHPLKIGNKFSVDWEGKVTASYIDASGGTIGPFTIDSKALYSEGNALGSSGVYLGKAGLSVNNDLIVRTSPGTNEYTLTVGGTSYFGGPMTVAGSLSVTSNGSITAAGSITANGTLTTNGSLVVANGGSFGGDINVTGNLRVSGTIYDSNGRWSSTGQDGGSQKLYGTSGNIGNWGINNGTISNASGNASLTSKGLFKAGNIQIDGTDSSLSKITFTAQSLELYGQSANSGGYLYVDGGLQCKFLATQGNVTFVKKDNGGEFKCNIKASFGEGISVPSGKTITVGGKELKALAFADDIKKKFNISYVNFDFWYKVSEKTININKNSSNSKSSYYVGSVYGYKKNGSSTTYAVRKHSYVYSATFRRPQGTGYYYYTKLSFDGYPGPDVLGDETFYSGPVATIPYDYEYVDNYDYVTLSEGYYLYTHQDNPTVDFNTVEKSGYTKKTMALSKKGTKKVTFGPNDPTDSSSDTITLTNVDFS